MLAGKELVHGKLPLARRKPHQHGDWLCPPQRFTRGPLRKRCTEDLRAGSLCQNARLKVCKRGIALRTQPYLLRTHLCQQRPQRFRAAAAAVDHFLHPFQNGTPYWSKFSIGDDRNLRTFHRRFATVNVPVLIWLPVLRRTRLQCLRQDRQPFRRVNVREISSVRAELAKDRMRAVITSLPRQHNPEPRNGRLSIRLRFTPRLSISIGSGAEGVHLVRGP